MNKKTLIICSIIVAVLLIGAATAVFFLYSDVEQPTVAKGTLDDSRYGFFQVVPADAVSVIYVQNASTAQSLLSVSSPTIPMIPNGKIRDFISSLGSSTLGPLASQQAILSCHYVGQVEPLYVMDVGKSSAETPSQVAVIESLAAKAGLYSECLDCSSIAGSGTYLKGRKILLISTSDVLIESSERHITKGISVLDKEYFPEAVSAFSGAQTSVFICNEHVGKLIETICNKEYRSYGDAFKRFADWSAFSIEEVGGTLKMSGLQFCGSGANKFMNVFADSNPSTVSVFSTVPSYTVSAFSLPISDVEKAVEGYMEFIDTKSGHAKYASTQSKLKAAAGVAPSDWAKRLNLKEVAIASFYVKDKQENVLLLKVGNPDALSGLFGGLEPKAKPVAGDYAYAGFASSLFGTLFSVKDESKFTYMGGWLIVGSQEGVEEYLSGRALENPLNSYISGAGLAPELKNLHFLGYLSLSEDERVIDRLFRPQYAETVKQAVDTVVYAPALFSVSVYKGQKKMAMTLDKVSAVKSNAPEIERNTTVIVPKGPFSVKNSGTGKMNTFYQQDNMYLCLNDENGKGLWGAPFKTPLCGRAGTVDYFANGKLQILFASGTKLYLIDRLGRFVNPFPVELGKEVLLGPDIYDFSGQRKYNVMILHTDNTVDMYNLQGNKPESWKGITSTETIMDLPERIKVDGKTFWVVRTSLQTLIFPFYGGEPVVTLKGNDKIRPDSRITPVQGGVKATNYAGKEVTLTLK